MVRDYLRHYALFIAREQSKNIATGLSMDFLKSFQRLFPSFTKPTRLGWLS